MHFQVGGVSIVGDGRIAKGANDFAACYDLIVLVCWETEVCPVG